MELRYYQQEAISSTLDFLCNAPAGKHPVIAMPTGTGKSLVIAGTIIQFNHYFPRARWIKLTHDKRLIEQNAKKLTEMWGGAPLGIYSSGLGQKDTMHPIIYGGIQSVQNNPEAFGHRDFCIVDECHRVNPKADTGYYETFAALYRINPNIRFIGTSATIFRLGQGLITDNGIFTDIAYDITGVEPFNRLIREGFLCPLIPKQTSVSINVDDIKVQNGEFNLKQLQAAVDKDEITRAAIDEAIELGADRKRWLVFSSGVANAEHISEYLNYRGISSAAVHSKQNDTDNDKFLEQHKAGKLRAIVNNNILTTGYDDPEIDLIIVLRPTMSPGLWVQMLGRGTRPFPGKKDCLVLDYAKNSLRLGPINDPSIPKSKKSSTSEAPVKVCKNCNTYNHPKVTHCINCGAPFTFEIKITETAASSELIAKVEKEKPFPIVETFPVQFVYYGKINKGGKDMLKVTYVCSNGIQSFSELVLLDHSGYAKHKANDWWRARFPGDPPEADDDTSATFKALQLTSELKVPKTIKVWVNKTPYPEVMSYEY